MNIWLYLTLLIVIIPFVTLVLLVLQIVIGRKYEIETVNIKDGIIIHEYKTSKTVDKPSYLYKDYYPKWKSWYFKLILGIRKKYLRVLIDGENISYPSNIKEDSKICYIASKSKNVEKSFEAEFKEGQDINFKQLILVAFVVIIILIIYSWWNGGKI